MEGSISRENFFLLYAFLLGIYITFLYDLFRIFRRLVRHNLFFISVEDLLFWTYTTFTVFYVMQSKSNGTLRWYAIAGAAVGMVLYKKTVGAVFVKWTVALIRAVLQFIKKRLAPVRRRARRVKKKLTQKLKLLKMTLYRK